MKQVFCFFWILFFASAFVPFRYTPAEFVPYTQTIPASEVSFKMVAIPAGEFLMGSSEAEAKRKPDEGPQHKVKLDAFWMSEMEVTWDMFELYAYKELEKKTAENLSATNVLTNKAVDAVSRPTTPYVDMSFGMGKTGYPAICMTHYAAVHFCKWLYAKTGVFYRLPTEAEWEYACRAGTTTPYSFGDSPDQLGEYAWYYENSNGKTQRVGKKKPNPWGLYDMHGNVAEWTYDQYVPEYYKQLAGKTAVNPVVTPTKLYPHAVKGGSWDDDADKLRSAARRGSNAQWKKRDPQLPRSAWWLTDAQFVGFRVIRPLKQPTPEEIEKYFYKAITDQ
jgi:formylglycine-generating enzyme required for sulfatase activity